MLSKYGYVIYSWISTLLFAGLIYWIATIPNFEVNSDVTNEVVKVLFRMVLYAFLFILLYRSFIATFRNSVQRLSHWRSKGEAAEDYEFVLIIETLIVSLTATLCTVFAAFEEYTQAMIPGRRGDVKDVLISIMAVLLSALVVYSMPAVGELEMAIKHYYIRRRDQAKAKKD